MAKREIIAVKGSKCLTLRDVGLDKIFLQELALKEKPEDKTVAQVVGTATSYRVEENKRFEDNDFLRFRGSFHMVNVLTGETVTAGSCILPGIAESMVGADLAMSEGGVEFAISIGIKYDPDAATSYRFTGTAYKEPGPSKFDHLLERLPAQPMLTGRSQKKIGKNGKS